MTTAPVRPDSRFSHHVRNVFPARSTGRHLTCVGIFFLSAVGFSPISSAQSTTGKPVEDLSNMVKSLGGLISNLVSPKGQKFRALLAEKKYFDAAEMYAVEFRRNLIQLAQ